MTATTPHNFARAESCKGVRIARTLLEVSPLHSGWGLDALAGRFIELVGGPESGTLTTAISLVLDAQRRQELGVWISGPGSSFYPPDAAAAGADLTALPTIQANTSKDAAHAADILLRSKSFALIVIDAGGMSQFSLSMQTRLTGLTAKANATLVCLSQQSHKHGSLVSFRGQTQKTKTGHNCFECAITALKDKRTHPGWVHKEVYRGTDGLC